MIEFQKHGGRDETLTSKRRIWLTKCGRYRVVKSMSKYGLPTIYYAMEYRDTPESNNFAGWGWDIISKHRAKSAAFVACEKQARANERQARKRRKKS